MAAFVITVFIIGRILLGGYFLYNAYSHFTKTQWLAGYAASKGVPFAKAGVIASGVLFALGGISIILGMQMVIGLSALVVALIPITIKMHAFWKDTDPQVRMGEQINFFKNCALTGSLLITIALAFLVL